MPHGFESYLGGDIVASTAECRCPNALFFLAMMINAIDSSALVTALRVYSLS